MSETILGIDIGSDTLKVVQVQRSLRAVEISGYASAHLPADSDSSQVARTLKDLVSEHNLESDRYVLSVGTQEAFLRRLSFPFASQRKIAEVIKFELEAGLPLGIEKVMIDFVKTETLPDGSQGVLAAALPKQVLDALLPALGEVGIEVEVVDLDGSGLSVIAGEISQYLPERALILDIGHSKTNLLYRQQGQTVYLRALLFGCSRLARAVAGVLKLPVEEGLKLVLSLGLDGPIRTTEDERAREVILREIGLLAREIEVSVLATKHQEHQSGPELLVLSGGGSLIGGLAPELQKSLDLQVICLADLEDVGLLNHFRDRPSVLAQCAIATGLSLRHSRRAPGFNFQAEEYRSRGPLDRLRQHWRYAIVAISLVVLSWLGSVWMDIYTKKQHLAQLDKSIEAVFRRAVPEVKGSMSSSQYASVLKSRIDDLSQSVALFGTESKQHLTVELLRSISQAVPANLDVTINMLTADGQRVRVNGKADAFDTVDNLKNRLITSGSFASVTISGAKAAADGEGVQFSLELLRGTESGENS
ncbi:MAG: pilus assembly protein PilM [Deltaproteobacteria bacterium]|nr:MAG: pilus assembly protein PilM [Deltaproteobacteria bacterium]